MDCMRTNPVAAIHAGLLFVLLMTPFGKARADAALDAAIDAVAPDIAKWASVCLVTEDAAGKPTFTWTDYRETGRRTDF